MNKNYKHCRLCGSQETIDIWDLGSTAPANAYINPTNPILNESYPLVVFLCSKCSSVQLRDSIDPEKLFKNYKYSSSTVASLVSHFSKMAFAIREMLPSNSSRKVLEIGSNDGVLLRHFKSMGFDVLGVEPSENLAEIANKEGLTTKTEFFNEKVAIKIVDELGKFDVVTCNNCFAHIDDINSVTEGIKRTLAPNGFFVFENAYLLDTLKGLYFDQCYHEHLFYHSIKPLKIFFDKHDLEIFKVEKVDIQGGSIRVFVKHAGCKAWPVHKSVEEFEAIENNAGLSDTTIYRAFIRKIDDHKKTLNDFVTTELRKGKTFSAYGAAAKFTTFCGYLGVSDKLKYVVDDSPLKWGLLTPDSLTPIIKRDEFLFNPTDYCIITAWNFSHAIVKNNMDYLEKGGKFIKPLPELEIISK